VISDTDMSRSILEAGLGLIALSASTFRPLYPSFFVVKLEKGASPDILPNKDEKQSLESDSSRDSSSVTGAQMSTRTTVQRKVSDEKMKDG
jgi:hypothetical protein